MQTIEYKGVEYPACYVGNGALISVEGLNDILTKDICLGDEEAYLLDEQISGYVSDKEINLSYFDLVNLCIDYGIIERIDFKPY